jgi:diguanylate cyclase (GGDEF)-like protein
MVIMGGFIAGISCQQVSDPMVLFVNTGLWNRAKSVGQTTVTAAASVGDGSVPSAAILGSVLLALVGALVVATCLALHLPTTTAETFGCIGGADVLAAVGLAVLPWQRFSRRSLLVFPFGLLATAFLAASAHQATGSTFVGCIGIAVVYLGLTQPCGTTLRSLPFLALAWWPTSAPHDARTFVRLAMSLLMWSIVGEVLAHYRREQQRVQTQLLRASETDPLTGLGNRRVLDQALDELPDGGRVIMLDLDHFKEFNDRRGHGCGDDLLREFARVLTGAVRSDDAVCRYGGEEFVVVIAEAASGADVLDRVRAAWQALDVEVTFSAGLARRYGNESPQDTLRRADAAMYAAKRGGRDMAVLDLFPTQPPEVGPSRHSAVG